MEAQTQTTQQPKKRRGRPAGSKDSKPRVRRGKGEAAAPKPAKKERESDIQSQFIKWLGMRPAPGFPGCKLGDFTHAIPNGIWIPAPLKQRIMIIMSQRRQGMRKGYPDVCIDLPLHGYHGARIELKRVSRWEFKDEQREWLERLRSAGFFCEVAHGVAGACDAVERYLRGEPPLPFPGEEGTESVHVGSSAASIDDDACSEQNDYS